MFMDRNTKYLNYVEVQKRSTIAIKILTGCFKYLYESTKAKNHQYIHEEEGGL